MLNIFLTYLFTLTVQLYNSIQARKNYFDLYLTKLLNIILYLLAGINPAPPTPM